MPRNVIFGVALASIPTTIFAQNTPTPAPSVIVKTYCVSCHSGQAPAGRLSPVWATRPACQRRLKIPHFAGRKFPSPGRVVVYSFGWWNQNDFQPVKRRRALVETNLPRNSWSQTHQDDETRSEVRNGLAPGFE